MVKKMDEKVLFDLLNTAEKQIIENSKCFFKLWNSQISNCLCCDKHFNIEEHISIYGSFKLSLDEFLKLDQCWRVFFEKKGKIENNIIWLRGYSYYECDPQMHTKNEVLTEQTLWKKFTKHWNEYKKVELEEVSNKFDVFNWLATIAFLEYLFNDLTTLLWFILINKKEIKKLYNYSILLSNVESESNEVASLLSSLLKLELPEDVNSIIKKIKSIISNDEINEFLRISDNISSFEHGCIRAVREADSLALIYSAYLFKLLPFCETTSNKRILFLSNAFGALNIGYLFKNLIKSSIHAEHVNVHFSQHRADSAQIGKSSGEVKLLNHDSSAMHLNKETCVIVVDDCIFTGKSFFNIKKEFEDKVDVYLLPLSLDIQSLKYYNRNKRNIEKTYHTSKNALIWANELGDRLPAFEAFWDWKNFSEDSIRGAKTDFDRIINGGDVLLKKLWIRYQKDICIDDFK